MSSEPVEKIARAVLYEGYLLYPYRRSAIKNRQRWNFGVLYPESWAASQTGSDRSFFQTECLAIAGPQSRLDIALRFLHIVIRRDAFSTWEEGMERSLDVRDLPLDELASHARVEEFSFTASEWAHDGAAYRQEAIRGEIEVGATRLQDQVFRIHVRASNKTAAVSGDRPMDRSLASAHTVLTLRAGVFVSQTDPPDSLKDAAEACDNVGVWPVLAGSEGARDTMLGSPIILSDYPQIAPESGGDLFDGTEIDEILSLRILTMTDAEKAEMRSDERARIILERLEANPPEHLMSLHGAVREMTLGAPPLKTTRVGGVELRKGDRVRLWPGKRADIFDTLLEGKIAIIEAIEQDFEDNVHFAVVLEDDPGRDLGELRQIGHRFFFSGSEIEPIPRVHSSCELTHE